MYPYISVYFILRVRLHIPAIADTRVKTKGITS